MLNLLEYLERTAARTPEKTAFADEGRSFTFAGLLEYARRCAAAIAQHTNAVNRPIAVLTDRTAVTLAAFQGVLASGNYYVPLDDHMPEQRMKAVLQQLSPALLLYAPAQEPIARTLDGFCPSLCLDEVEHTAPDAALVAARQEMVLDIDPAYVIFTSGSTGTPKGIVISHRSVIDFTEWMADACGITGDDVMANQAPFYFDLSVKDIYLTLKCGATTHILSKKLFMFPLMLLRKIEEVGATALIWATSAFNLVATSKALAKCQPQSLRHVIVGGEALMARNLNIWRAALPEVQYINLYGPTEVTVDCTWYPVPQDRTYEDGEPLPIGTPCRNKQVLLLDENLCPVPDGTPGEICVRGIGLAHGYYADPDKTAAAFVQNPLNPDYPDVIYRTGDIGVRREDGLLYFSARKDGQIKHMGYRIELGEIETALHSLPDVPNAVCFFDEGRDRIVCCYEGALTPSELVEQLKTRLPRYMLPNIWVAKERLPYNANGKVDRVTLREEYQRANGS